MRCCVERTLRFLDSDKSIAKFAGCLSTDTSGAMGHKPRPQQQRKGWHDFSLRTCMPKFYSPPSAQCCARTGFQTGPPANPPFSLERLELQ